jgi:hypothetical protein
MSEEKPELLKSQTTEPWTADMLAVPEAASPASLKDRSLGARYLERASGANDLEVGSER